MEKVCGRCGEAVTDDLWRCWWCGSDMCLACGNAVGHCGHPEAIRENEASRAESYEDRGRILELLKSPGFDAPRPRGVLGLLPVRSRGKPN